MNRYIKKMFPKDKKIKKIIGVVLILIGFVSLITPLTPGSWLIFVGLQLLGLRLLVWGKTKQRLKKWRNSFRKA